MTSRHHRSSPFLRLDPYLLSTHVIHSNLSCHHPSLSQGLPVPESHPFLSPPFLRSCLPSYSKKVWAASVLPFPPPPIQGLPGPMRPPPALFFVSIFFGQPHPELASTRHFANVFAFSTLFHHASCLPHVPSRRHV